jgi:glycerate dehydrogenase
MFSIVFLEGDTLGKDASLAPIEQQGNLKVYGATLPGEIKKRIARADCIIVNQLPFGQAEIDAAPQLKLICISATGMNRVDLDYAKRKGIVVKNVVGYSTNSVVQLTFALLLNMLCSVSYFDRYIKTGGYANSSMYTHFGKTFHELSGKRAGIIGLGTIGKKVADIASLFGAQVVYYSTSGKNNQADYLRVELDELLRTSDIVSIHAPLNEQTKNLLTYDKLQLMKPSACLLNMGRGGIVNERDLARALNENLIRAAGTDVYEQEPIPADHPFSLVKDKDKLLLTPHIAWASIEARKRLVERVAENIRVFKATGQ